MGRQEQMNMAKSIGTHAIGNEYGNGKKVPFVKIEPIVDLERRRIPREGEFHAKMNRFHDKVREGAELTSFDVEDILKLLPHDGDCLGVTLATLKWALIMHGPAFMLACAECEFRNAENRRHSLSVMASDILSIAEHAGINAAIAVANAASAAGPSRMELPEWIASNKTNGEPQPMHDKNHRIAWLYETAIRECEEWSYNEKVPHWEEMRTNIYFLHPQISNEDTGLHYTQPLGRRIVNGLFDLAKVPGTAKCVQAIGECIARHPQDARTLMLAAALARAIEMKNSGKWDRTMPKTPYKTTAITTELLRLFGLWVEKGVPFSERQVRMHNIVLSALLELDGHPGGMGVQKSVQAQIGWLENDDTMP